MPSSKRRGFAANVKLIPRPAIPAHSGPTALWPPFGPPRAHPRPRICSQPVLHSRTIPNYFALFRAEQAKLCCEQVWTIREQQTVARTRVGCSRACSSILKAGLLFDVGLLLKQVHRLLLDAGLLFILWGRFIVWWKFIVYRLMEV